MKAINAAKNPLQRAELRDTKYARERARACYGDARIELLYIKAEEEEQIRFSWWPNGKMAQKPLDLTEEDLLRLFGEAIKENIFSKSFKRNLAKLLSEN